MEYVLLLIIIIIVIVKKYKKNKDKTILKLLRIPVQDFYNLEDLERKITEF